MDRTKVIERVRKLQALAADRAATEPEAALAKERAGDLIRKYEILPLELNPAPALTAMPMHRRYRTPGPTSRWGPTSVIFSNGTIRVDFNVVGNGGMG